LFGDKLELLYGPYVEFEHEQVVEVEGDGTEDASRRCFLRTDHAAAGVGITLKTGESPDDAFGRQSYWQFSVKRRMQ
jgi:hypothetical protein